MQTRSTRNLRRVQMMDLITDDPDSIHRRKSSARPKRELPTPPQIIDQRVKKRTVPIAPSSTVSPVTTTAPTAALTAPLVPTITTVTSVPSINLYFQSLTDVLRSKIYNPNETAESAWNLLRDQREERAGRQEVYLVLDTESYQIESELGSKTIVPLQVAWGIYKWNPYTLRLDLITKNTCYITEIMCIGRFRDAIKKVSERSYLKHEANLKTKGYPLLAVKDLLKVLDETIQSYCVTTLVGYNISWDFDALGNLIRLFGVEHASFDCRCDNPFNPLKIMHVDLMHEMVKKYGRRLVQLGIKDGSVSKDPHKTWLRKNTKYSKTIYSAEFVLQHLFGISQQHLADDDVEHEALMLEKIIQEFGESSLECGIMYPQRSSYEYMVRIANEELASTAETEETVIQVLSKLKTTTELQRQPTPFPNPAGTEACLFDQFV